MIKRLVCLLSAVMVAASSAFAWDAYSFTGVYSAPFIPNFVLAESFASDSVLIDSDIDSWFQRFSLSSLGDSYIGLGLYSTFTAAPGFDPVYVHVVHVPFALTGKYPSSGVATSYMEFRNPPSQPFSVSYRPDDQNVVDSFSGPYFLPGPNSSGQDASTSLFLSLNISDLSSFSSFEIDGSLRLCSYIYSAGVGYLDRSYTGGSVSLYVDGALIHTFHSDSSGVVDFDHYIFNGTFNVSSIDFSFSADLATYSMSEDETVSNIATGYYFDQWSLSLFTVGDLTILDGNVNQAQDDINAHESIESQWTGSMTSNFDALDLGNFSFPSGLVSGFALITGIFQDLWNSMGEYKILFVFPLTLGVVLLLIGRISKFSGGHSSRSSGRSDDA